MNLRHEIMIEADIKDVWQKTIDFDNWASWNPNVEWAKSNFNGIPKNGDTFTLKQKGMKEVIWTIDQLELNTICGWKGSINGMNFKARHQLITENKNTKNILILEVDGGVVFTILSPFLSVLFNSALKKENTGLRDSFL